MVERPKTGDIRVIDGRRYVVVSVTPRMSPYTKRGQDTRVEGWVIGLREDALWS